jgi:hypothetical protein
MKLQTLFLVLLLPVDQTQWAVVVMYWCQSLLPLQRDGWVATAPLQSHHMSAMN